MVGADDSLIDYTEKGHYYGFGTTLDAYANAVPHFIWKDKYIPGAGNTYAHEFTELSEDDTTTGISFSPAADAFHQAGWLGLLGLIPLQMFLTFFLTDSLVGNVRQSPWALIWILELSHFAPELGVQGPIYLITIGIESALFTYFVLKWTERFLRSLKQQGDRSELTTLAPPGAAVPEAVR